MTFLAFVLAGMVLVGSFAITLGKALGAGFQRDAIAVVQMTTDRSDGRSVRRSEEGTPVVRDNTGRTGGPNAREMEQIQRALDRQVISTDRLSRGLRE